jgi:hypothetical protein
VVKDSIHRSMPLLCLSYEVRTATVEPKMLRCDLTSLRLSDANDAPYKLGGDKHGVQDNTGLLRKRVKFGYMRQIEALEPSK